jgi:polyketide cyclase/dehydrase/lipid transport protein
VIPLVIQTALFLAVVALLIGALLTDRSGVRGGDYLVFESRAVLSQRLTLAAFVLIIIEFLIGTPLLGAVLAIIAVLWTLWWLPAEHRRFDVAVRSVFEAPPEAVAAVMFDVSEQPRWMDSIVRTALETPGLLRKGSVIRQTLRVSGQDLVAKLVVVELVPYERLLLQVTSVRHAELFDLLEVQPHESGSMVTYSGRHQLSRLNAVLTGWRLPSLRKRFAERRNANLERLRTIVRPAPLARQA